MKSLKELYKIGYGPSSSHTMGPAKAISYMKSLYPNASEFKVTLYGSLALTGKGHLTDEIINKVSAPIKSIVVFNYTEKCDYHPNTLDITAIVDCNEFTKRFYSIGGGSIEIDGVKLELEKEYYKENSLKDIKSYLKKSKISLIDYVLENEDSDIKEYLLNCYHVMKDSIKRGLNTEGYLPGSLHVERKAKSIFNTNVDDSHLNLSKRVFAYAFAVSEENASGSIIVTAPTCGASGLLPAVLYGFEEEYGLTEEQIVEAMMVSGIIGNLVKENASISGAEAGCQAEIGTACAMGAAAASYLLDANIDQIEQAAEIALEHHLGLTCDPIDGYVQIPCIERNAVCALRAIDATNLVIFINPSASKISFDLVTKTMLQTGHDLKENYRETAQGGLAKEYKK